MTINGVEIKNVKEFKYLGLKMYNNVVSPEQLLSVRLAAAKRTFNAVKCNCRILGISNVRVKISLITALVSSILLYGSIIYACTSDVDQMLTLTNRIFSAVKIF
jgi:hypothetical protein